MSYVAIEAIIAAATTAPEYPRARVKATHRDKALTTSKPTPSGCVTPTTGNWAPDLAHCGT